jgi:hypothetical protein
MYQVSLEGLCRMNYFNRVKGFINYALYKYISGNGIRYPCKRCKNKNFLDLDVVTMHLLQKKVHKEIFVLVCTWRTIYSLQDQVHQYQYYQQNDRYNINH